MRGCVYCNNEPEIYFEVSYPTFKVYLCICSDCLNSPNLDKNYWKKLINREPIDGHKQISREEYLASLVLES